MATRPIHKQLSPEPAHVNYCEVPLLFRRISGQGIRGTMEEAKEYVIKGILQFLPRTDFRTKAV